MNNFLKSVIKFISFTIAIIVFNMKIFTVNIFALAPVLDYPNSEIYLINGWFYQERSESECALYEPESKDKVNKNIRIADNVLFDGKLKRVTAVAQGCFLGCNSVENVVLPDSVEIIETGAFARCENLRTIMFTSSVKTIKNTAFCGAISLETIYFIGTEKQWNDIIIESEFNEPLFASNIIFLSIDYQSKYDVNNDLEINNKDVTALFRAVNDSDHQEFRSLDINQDGFLDNKDIVCLFRYINK